jgi:hypothetical protein
MTVAEVANTSNEKFVEEALKGIGENRKTATER